MGIKIENRVVLLIDSNLFNKLESGINDLFKKINSYSKMQYDVVKMNDVQVRNFRSGYKRKKINFEKSNIYFNSNIVKIVLIPFQNKGLCFFDEFDFDNSILFLNFNRDTKRADNFELYFSVIHWFIYQAKIPFKLGFNMSSHFFPCVNIRSDDWTVINTIIKVGDICDNCIDYYNNNKVNYSAVFNLMQDLEFRRRGFLNYNHLFLLDSPVKLHILGINLDIFIEDGELVKIPLTPLEKVVYLLFVCNIDGVALSNVAKYQDWMNFIYGKIAATKSPLISSRSIQQLTNPIDNSISEKISRVRSKIKNYTSHVAFNACSIEGPRGGKRLISISRSNIQFDSKSRKIIDEGAQYLSLE